MAIRSPWYHPQSLPSPDIPAEAGIQCPYPRSRIYNRPPGTTRRRYHLPLASQTGGRKPVFSLNSASVDEVHPNVCVQLPQSNRSPNVAWMAKTPGNVAKCGTLGALPPKWQAMAPTGPVRFLIGRYVGRNAPSPPLLDLIALHSDIVWVARLGDFH